jgi:hypothetical protein
MAGPDAEDRTVELQEVDGPAFQTVPPLRGGAEELAAAALDLHCHRLAAVTTENGQRQKFRHDGKPTPEGPW